MLPVWIDVFCRSFAVPQWKKEVERVVSGNAEGLELLLSYRGGIPAGCAALYHKNGVTGLYCLGTISHLRGRGVARSILRSVMFKGLLLQTLGSERLLPFYGRRFCGCFINKIYVHRPKQLRLEKSIERIHGDVNTSSSSYACAVTLLLSSSEST